VTGFYGAGKTTALECAIEKIIEKIIEKPTEFPNPKIIFCTWDESQELQGKFEEKMEKIKSQNYPHIKEDSLQVVSLEVA
jgi:precorrin-4 methylase